MSQTQTKESSQSKGTNLLLKEAPTVTQPRLQDILGDLEARILQQIYYWINNPYSDPYLKCEIEIRVYQGRVWAKIPPAFFLNRWRGKFRFSGDRTFKAKITALRTRGVLLTEKFGGDTNWYCVLDETVIHYDGIFQTYFDQVATERAEARHDPDNRLLDITPAREEEIWEEMQKELEASFIAHGDGKALKKEFAARALSRATAKAAAEKKARATAKDASRATDVTAVADEQCKICTPGVQPIESNVSSAEYAHEAGRICTPDVQNMPDASAEFDVAPYIQEQQQEFVPEQTIQEGEKAPLISPLADVLQAFVPNVDCSLNSSNVVVVEDDEIEANEESDSQATRRELIAVNVTERDADALLAEFGADECLAAIDQRGGIKKLIAQLRSLENAAQGAVSAPVEQPKPKTQTEAPRAATAPPKAIPLPAGHELDEADALAQLAARFAQLGFTGGVRGSARFIEKHGASECAFQLERMAGHNPHTPGAWLRMAVVAKDRDEVRGGADAPQKLSAAQVAAAKAQREARERESKAAREAMDERFLEQSDIMQTRIKDLVLRILGERAEDGDLLREATRDVTGWHLDGRLDEAEDEQTAFEANQAEFAADRAKHLARKDEQKIA